MFRMANYCTQKTHIWLWLSEPRRGAFLSLEKRCGMALYACKTVGTQFMASINLLTRIRLSLDNQNVRSEMNMCQ